MARLTAGLNVRMRRMPRRTILGFKGGGAAVFEGAFFAMLSGLQATFTAGSVNGLPATIEDVPLDGTLKLPSPALLMKTFRLDEDGRGYFAVEITCDPKAEWRVARAEMAQVADPNTDDGGPGETVDTVGGAKPLSGYRARWPVAMLRQRASGLVEVIQQVWFPLEHRVALDTKGNATRHFFS